MFEKLLNMTYNVRIHQIGYSDIHERASTPEEIYEGFPLFYAFDLMFEKLGEYTIVTFEGRFNSIFPQAKKTIDITGNTTYRVDLEISSFYSPNSIVLADLVELGINFFAQTRGYIVWLLQKREYFHIEHSPFLSSKEMEEAILLLYSNGVVVFR